MDALLPENVFGPLLTAIRGSNAIPSGVAAVCDSREVTPGSIFAAIPGVSSDGSTFIPDAIAAGAAVIIHQYDLPDYPENVTFFQVSDVRQAYSLLIRRICGDPDKKLRIYGITGTNGKTTSAYLLRHLLNCADVPCGLISTVEYDDGKNITPPTHTTPAPQTLFPLLEAMVKNSLRAAAMEFSSHALDQKRLHGITLRGAIFTNLTGDHLDYHRDMESYYQAKKTLFTDLLCHKGIAAINIDTADGERLAGELAIERPDLQIPTFGKKADAGWRISEAVSDLNGCRFVLSNAVQAFEVIFPLSGEYNISNLAGVLTLLLCDGISPESINQALNLPMSVPGRLEKLTAPNGANFFVDYAHTDDALRNVLTTLRKCCSGKLIAVFGAGGNRDKSKRPRMGQVAAETADHLIVTSDNPRSERPEDIISDIVAGIPAGSSFETVVSREDAIIRAVNMAQKDDVVLIAGKGHENYQEINGVKIHFDDREILRKLFGYSDEKID